MPGPELGTEQGWGELGGDEPRPLGAHLCAPRMPTGLTRIQGEPPLENPGTWGGGPSPWTPHHPRPSHPRASFLDQSGWAGAVFSASRGSLEGVLEPSTGPPRGWAPVGKGWKPWKLEGVDG